MAGAHDSLRRHNQNPTTPGVFDVRFANVSRPPSPVGNGYSRSAKQKQFDLFALPPPQETLQLVQKYFSDTGLLFPYIYPPTFLETLQLALEDNLRKIRRTWLGLLNMMLAMVKLTDEKPAETRIAEANTFYQRALGLCGNEMLRGTTTEVGESSILESPIERVMILMELKSSIPASYGSVPPRHAEVRTSLDKSWSRSQSSFSIGFAFKTCDGVI